MPRIAFLSTDNLEDFFVYDELLIPYFEAHNWDVQTVSWHDKTVIWDEFQYVIVRSTWDYQQQPEAFMQCLTAIEQSQAILLNPLSLIKWNIEKYYLQDLESKGVATINTMWCKANSADVIDSLHSAFSQFKTSKVVIKPVLSANADNTFVVTPESIASTSTMLCEIFGQRSYMIQPFLSSVVEEGEYSLFFFSHHYSHAIRKVPKSGDFRVQEEHGGQLYCVEATQEQLAIAQRALAAMPDEALYARVDLVRQNTSWAVMELELIEPSLYFNLDENSPTRFVTAMLDLHRKKSEKGSHSAEKL
ncbi:hypothetical protein D210916BOD24_34210 [Alteromonas sp. D210916BOD_24]|uniref:ATP-grasp domain-containing protein n=1 Tax=Alteromonas sp. D210916BOD_24 TaxID=3157618 RepID=UPI00399C8A63